MPDTCPKEFGLIAEKGGTPYIKPKKSSLMKAGGCYPWKSTVVLFREHPRIFNRFYRLLQRESRVALLKKPSGRDLVRGRTEETMEEKIWSKIVCYNLIWTIRGNHGF